MDFKIEKKGYNTKQVEEYINEVKKVYDEALTNQKDRIFELKSQLLQAEKDIKSYKEKSSLVSKAILNAVSKAEEIERLSQIKYNQEISQLNAFHDKWTEYYNKILDRYPLDDQLAAAGRFNSQMTKILSRAGCDSESEPLFKVNEAEQNFSKESDRLSETQIGYIRVKTEDGSAAGASEDININEIIPGADPNSPIMSGNFDPLERINKYFASEQTSGTQSSVKSSQQPSKKTDVAATSTTLKTGVNVAESDRSPSGFSLEECLNPKEDLTTIMRDLGLLLDE